MADFSVNEMQQMQKELQEKYKGESLILITILTQDKIIVKMVITPETLLTN